MQKIIGTVILLVVLVGGGIFVINKSDDANERDASVTETENKTTVATNNPTPVNNIAVGEPAPGGYTAEDVSKHADAKSCWSVVNGKVYDLTNWIGKHPGGEKAILSICGKDGTASFTGKHGGQEKPEATLATFMIGTLKASN